MYDFVKEQLLALIKKSNYVKNDVEYSTQVSNVEIPVPKGVSSNGIEYDKMKLFRYLRENSLNINKENIDKFAANFSVTDETYTETHTQVSKNTTIKLWNDEPVDSLSDDEILGLKDLILLDYINKIANQEKTVIMEYAVATVIDNYKGGTDIPELERTLNKYAEMGYVLKTSFTNELGVNSSSVSFGGVSTGTNATIDQIVLIFERPKRWVK